MCPATFTSSMCINEIYHLLVFCQEEIKGRRGSPAAPPPFPLAKKFGRACSLGDYDISLIRQTFLTHVN
jgi:hypothetical protein